MPSSRRIKLVFVSVITVTVLFIYYNTAPSIDSRESYMATLQKMHERDKAEALQRQRLQDSLREAAVRAKGLANSKVPNPNSAVKRPVDRGPDTDVKAQAPEEVKIENPQMIGEDIPARTPPKAEKETVKNAVNKEDEASALHTEIAAILNRSPIIIFSKSYCPYSLAAKKLLLKGYKITPAPVVIELDQHPMGKAIQEWLGQSTGRKTVPNIIVNSKSIGGSDEIHELDQVDKLESTIRGIANKQIVEITKLAAT